MNINLPHEDDITPGWWWELKFNAPEKLAMNLSRQDSMNTHIEALLKKWEDLLFRAFKQKYGQPTLVYYPCSALHISPSFTFENVIYTDLDAGSMEFLRKHWYNALTTDVTKLESIEGKQPDLMIIYNPQINDLEALTRPLKKWWYIICNNYHCTADNLWRNPHFTFIESLDGKGDGTFVPMKEEDYNGDNPFAARTMEKCLFQKK